jgi:hypothetical protein
MTGHGITEGYVQNPRAKVFEPLETYMNHTERPCLTVLYDPSDSRRFKFKVASWRGYVGFGDRLHAAMARVGASFRGAAAAL